MMDKNQRPRTKRLERPTPNLTHPVISNKKLNANQLQLEDCIQIMNKCQINSSTKASNKMKVISTPTSISDNIRQTNKQKISEFKLNFNQSNVSMKSSVLQTKSQDKCSLLVRDNSEDTDSRSTEVQKATKERKDQMVDSNSSLKTTEKEESDWSGWQQFNAQLIPCSHCCRTFFPHRLPVHEKCCKGVSVKKTSHRSKPVLRTGPIVKCVSLECITCGRKYRTTSLTSHQLKCKTNNFRKRFNTVPQNKSITDYRLRSRLRDESKGIKKSVSDKLEENELESHVFQYKSDE